MAEIKWPIGTTMAGKLLGKTPGHIRRLCRELGLEKDDPSNPETAFRIWKEDFEKIKARIR